MVGIDGGYVRSRDKRQPHFEVMVVKSMPEDRPNRYLGLVHTHDSRPKRRLHEVLKEQGLQENQPVTFLTDGGATANAFPPGSWRVPSTQSLASALASANRCDGQSLVHIFSFKPGREPPMARSEGSSSSGTRA